MAVQGSINNVCASESVDKLYWNFVSCDTQK